MVRGEDLRIGHCCSAIWFYGSTKYMGAYRRGWSASSRENPLTPHAVKNSFFDFSLDV